MRKDIDFPQVEGVFIVVARETDELNQSSWKVHLINRNPFPLENVFVTSNGYGNYKDEKQETSTLRHHFPHISEKETALIEPIDSQVFHLTNQYWLSYYAKGKLFDKKFIFLPDSILEENLIKIPEFEEKVVMHS